MWRKEWQDSRVQRRAYLPSLIHYSAVPLLRSLKIDNRAGLRHSSENRPNSRTRAGMLMAELIDACEGGHDHDREQSKVTGRYTGCEIALGFFSRLRQMNRESSFSVLG